MEIEQKENKTTMNDTLREKYYKELTGFRSYLSSGSIEGIKYCYFNCIVQYFIYLNQFWWDRHENRSAVSNIFPLF